MIHVHPPEILPAAKEFALLPQKCLLLCLRSPAKVSETQVTEVSQDDYLDFKACREQ